MKSYARIKSFNERLKQLEAKQARLKAPGLALILNRDKSFTIGKKHYPANTPWPAEVIGVFPETIGNLEEWQKCAKGEVSYFNNGKNWDPVTLETLEKGKK